MVLNGFYVGMFLYKNYLKLKIINLYKNTINFLYKILNKL